MFLSVTGLGHGQIMEITGLGAPAQTTDWPNGLYPAGKAVDGDPGTFSHTDAGTSNNAWELVFENDFGISRVELQMRGDCCGGRLTGAILRLFDGEGDSVYDEEISDPGVGQITVIQIPPGVKARKIRVGLENGGTNPGSTNSLIHLGEVRVFSGEPPATRINSFGPDRDMIASGEVVTLSWATENADEVTLTEAGSVPSTGMVMVSPSRSTIYQLVATSDLGPVLKEVVVMVDGELLPPRITEFMASNSDTILRSDGSSPDWIEIWNPNPTETDLGGFQLVDRVDPVSIFSFPAMTLAGGEYLVVDAAEIGVDGVPATGFSLNRSAGSELILRDPLGETLQYFSYPRQRADISFGPFGGSEFFFTTPTPGEPNSGKVVEGFVADTQFSVLRGFYGAPQKVEVTSETSNAEIYVTLDGTEPDPEDPGAILYTEAITISTTTVLRARAFKEGLEPTDIDTQTYLFTADVAGQSSSPDNFPPAWIPNLNVGVQRNPVKALSHYGFNSGVLGTLPMNDAIGGSFDLEDALVVIPTMSLVVDADELFDPVEGLHINAGQRGRAWERLASIEYLNPASGEMRQANCGIRMHGGWNRFPEMLKKSFRLYFRAEYGDASFDAPLFEDAPVDEYDRLIMRSGNGKAWTSPWRALSGSGNSLTRTTYFRDQLARDLQAATDQDSIPGTFVHLYINGHYWGLYNPVERPDEFFASGHWGGDDDDYDVIKWQRGVGHQVAAGSDEGWNELISLVRGTPRNAPTYEMIKELLDLENFIDYLLVNFFLGNQDWVDNNVYAMRNRAADGPFRFYCWDGEETLLSTGRNSTGQNVTDTCTEIHQRLRSNPEYRILFADRAQRHLFGGGALTLPTTDPLVAGYTAMLDRAIVAESARWGELHRPADPYDRADWLSEISNIRNNYLPNRGATLINQLNGQGLFPDTKAPEILPQAGGVVSLGTEVTFALPADAGTVLYTTDGTDPRLEGGGASPTAGAFGSVAEQETVLALGSVWAFRDTGEDLGDSTLVVGAAGYGSGNWKHREYEDTSWSSGPAPLGYGGISDQTIATTIAYGPNVNVKHRTSYFRHEFEATDVGEFDSLTLRIFRDDGAIVYLNGIEIVRSGFDLGDVVTSVTFAESASDEGVFLELNVPTNALLEGMNVIAVELHQASNGSSDLGFDLELVGEKLTTTSDPIEVTGGTFIKARVLSDGEWSPLGEALFSTGDRAGELVLSELMYHPLDGGAEFLEIMNRGEVNHSLIDLKLTGGIAFDFENASQSSLAPGESLVLVRDRSAFAVAYPEVTVGGDYDGALGNGGDVFSLESRNGEVLWTMSYGDAAPWPGSADGQGRSLTYRGGLKAAPDSWRPSVDEGGSPGVSDRVDFVDGGNLLNYALASFELLNPGGFEVSHRLGADDALVEVQWSRDLQNWTSEFMKRTDRVISGGEMREVWRREDSSPSENFFYRVKVALIER